MERVSEREREEVAERGAADRHAQEAPPSPASVSSARPVVSGLGLSSGSCGSPMQSSAGEVQALTGAAAQPPSHPVQDRLEWIRPKLSRKAKWRRRKSQQRLMRLEAPAARPVSPSMAGRCFKCLRPGNPKRECSNEQACYRCGEEGHGSGGCKRPRSPDSEEMLWLRAIDVVDRRLAGRRRGSQPGVRGQGAPATSGRRAPTGGDRPPAAPSSPYLSDSFGSGEAESALRQDATMAGAARHWPPCVVR
jgi:hypothetical protein